MTKLDITRDLIARGLHITWIDAGQKALTRSDWQNSPRVTEPEKLWGPGSNLNVAVLTGQPSGVFVLDIDTKEGAGGGASMKRFVEQYGPMPATLVVQTASGGFHYYFRMPTGFDVRNSAGSIKDGKLKGLAPGLDIRGTGGYVVGPGSHTVADPSRHTHEGDYRVLTAEPISDAPAWLVEWLEEQAKPSAVVLDNPEHVAGSALAPNQERWVVAALKGVISDLAALPRPWRPGAGWDEGVMRAARRLVELENDAPHLANAAEVLEQYGPYDSSWDQRGAKLKNARDFIGQKGSGAKMPAPKADIDLIQAEMDRAQAAPGATWAEIASGDRPMSGELIVNGVDVSSPATALDWMRDNLGRGRTSGIFRRGHDVVFTPKIGKDGYVAPKAGEPEGSASISVLDKAGLAARITSRESVFKQRQNKETKEWVEVPDVFPEAIAQHAVKAPDDFAGLRELHGVVHTPTFRPDGTLFATPGYDEATGVLFLPTGGQPDAVSESPDPEDVSRAKKIIDYMLQDFRFVTENDRANYIGLMLTPLLRSMTPYPYKLGVIEAHQPGSGKTFLARALISIHSGVMHAEMPQDEAELGKVVSALLDTSTGGVVVFDNVTGVVRSPTLAGLLTSPTFQGRRLGTGSLVDAVNDRLWVITGNNAALGGDLERRALPVRIDPGVPNPERRTDFAIPNFENWVRQHRGDILWALIVMIRHWVAQGSPLPTKVRADSYGVWAAVVGSVITEAGFDGEFDAIENVNANDPEMDEWVAFLEKVYEVHGETPWTVKQLLAQVAPLGFESTEQLPIPFDMLPESLMSGRQVTAATMLTRAMGKHLRNRLGRWFGRLTVRLYSSDPVRGNLYRVELSS